jgi:DNA-binding response OmpR family regulator
MKASDAHAPKRATLERRKGKRVVVVDDDRDFREACQEALESDGYEVSVVPNGLRLMAALKIDKPDLLLLDVMMSWISGFELCRTLKRNADYRDIPVLFMSARRSPSDIEEGLACGAIDYMTKPFDLATLLQKVHEIVGPSHAPEAPDG